ncbi:MAG: 4-hydroxy-3-methylbut-2-enyl diphosphate reductase [Bdellovibrionota bacterium]|nr:MAG: 4-hydroxy-3-methylbut-2-enyl diphosphate reductase [Bdellovibrionota bacterium]
MARKFDIPQFYRSGVVTALKHTRNALDQRKQDLNPTEIPCGRITFKIARHLGFCFGVENAIDIAYRAVRENPGKRVFLLSEMIHNPHVNSDLQARGVQFLRSTSGEQLIPFEQLTPQDIVIVPAFGTTVDLFATLRERGIDPQQYNATCPFVEKVWKRASQLGNAGFTVIIHGKHFHEETKATFSHAELSAPSVIIRDMREAEKLARYISKQASGEEFFEEFSGKCSHGFDPARHLAKIGVVNQTTMLATETQAIAEYLRSVMRETYGAEALTEHFADTRDTLCYATYENQEAVGSLVRSGGDLALVVGGYNSSNTFHLARICAGKLPTFYVKDADEILDLTQVRHLNLETHDVEISKDWFPVQLERVTVLITAGASCPDALVEAVIRKVALIAGVEPVELEQASERYIRTAEGTAPAP